MEKSTRPDTRSKLSANYGRMLVVLGIVVLACIIIRSALSLGLFVVTTIREGPTGNFLSDQLPMIVLLLIVGLGVFGIYKLVQVLRK